MLEYINFAFILYTVEWITSIGKFIFSSMGSLLLGFEFDHGGILIESLTYLFCVILGNSLGDLYSLDSDFSDFSYSFYFSLTLYELFLIYFSMIFALISQGRSMNVWCVVKAVAVLLHYLVIFTLDYESRI